MKNLFIIFSFLLLSCGDDTSHVVSISPNTFVYEAKVYRVIDNQITELGDLKKDSIARSKVLTAEFRHYGSNELSYIKKGAECVLSGVYRGDILYFKLKVDGLNDLREKYSRGTMTINFQDEYGFMIHNTEINSGELIKIVGSSGEALYFEYYGKTQMSSEVYAAISNYSVTSTLQKRSLYGW